MDEEIVLVNLNGMAILQQLQLEEALLRADERNFCLLNHGVKPAIVMGISGKAEEHLHLDLVESANIPVIRRFSGGGTVVVDENTLFASFILQSKNVLKITPDIIHQWAKAFYKDVFKHPEFSLLENDYVFGRRKMGGNAQYIRKSRWLHHTSFLWNYDERRMNFLKMPPKAPTYRNSRSHGDFLCKLENHLPVKTTLFDSIQNELERRFTVKMHLPEEALKILSLSYRKSVELISVPRLTLKT